MNWIKVSVVVSLVFLLLTMSTAWAQTPNFDYGYFMTDSESYIVIGNVYVIPHMGDWDDDGDDDLMVGVFFDGNIQYYENVSTGIEPEFASYELLQADGSPISVSYG